MSPGPSSVRLRPDLADPPGDSSQPGRQESREWSRPAKLDLGALLIMRSEQFLVLSLGAVLAAAGPVPSSGAFSPAVVTGDRLSPIESLKTLKGRSSAITLPDSSHFPKVEPADPEALVRSKRNSYYERDDPWGRDRMYGRRRYKTGRRKYNSGRIRYFYQRKKPSKNGGPDYNYEDSSPKYSNEGYVPRAVVSAPPSEPRRSTGGFVSARSSGVARVEETA